MDLTNELLVRQARVTLGGRDILRDIDLALPKGQVLALLGGSGCGKTTLLRTIAGLAPISSGQVLLQGRDVTALPPQQRGVGVVFQHYALFPNLSVLENIKFGVLADGHTQAEAQRRADELLDLVELQAHARKLPAQLSGGQRQRVALARALARKPSLLLMDEPFSALDESFRVPLRRAFRRLQQSLGQSCLIVTHDREEAFELADQVAVMFDGRIEQCATPLTLWNQPATTRIADFLGAFNRFDASQWPELGESTGSWIAPITAFKASEASGDAWQVRAQLQARYVGQQSASLELTTAGGEALVVRCEHEELERHPVGAWLVLQVPRSALRHLAA
jgi:ABC-type Fe3+/spermidine/putrescine transport system ATPase subunit